MTVTSPVREPFGLAANLWSETKALHVQAERSGVIGRILHNTAHRHEYAVFLRNLLPAYLALEQGLERHRDTLGARRVAKPETYRAAALAADLFALAGEDWASALPLLPEGIAYGEAVLAAGEDDGALLIAHAYARTLGDLSGGQIMQKLLGRTLRLGADALSFYRFAGIADIGAFKAAYHTELDAAGREIADPAAVVAEAALAFRLNIALSEALPASPQQETI